MIKIGIATPIHDDELVFSLYLVNAFNNLEPRAYMESICINDGTEGLCCYRTELFNELFESGCDVVLQCSVDHYVHPEILSCVEENKITTFAYLKLKPSYVVDFIRFKISPNMWTGCYSIPFDFWGLFKNSAYFNKWDGGDYSIVSFANEINYPIKRIRKPMYTLLNPSKADPFKNIENYPLWKQIIRKVSWADH